MNTYSISALVVLALVALLVLLGRQYHRVNWGSTGLNILEGINQWLCHRYHRLDGPRLPLPDEGPALVASNHISGLDPLLLIAASSRPLRFLIAREEYERPGLTWLFQAVGCIPVDRKGDPNKALRAALRELEKGEVVALFPHGKIHLDSDPPRRLKGGVAWLAQRTGCPIVPVRLAGVRRQGHVLSPVLIRARARLSVFRPLLCEPGDHCLANLTEVLDGRAE